MRYRVVGKQPNSKMCLACGLQNDVGLAAAFYELENGELLAVFTPREGHQSYPGRLHGGIVSTMLDETIGRAIMISHAEQHWAVTVEISVRFSKPVPLGSELHVVGRVTKDSRRLFEGTGELLLPDGTVAASAHGKFMKMPLDQIADFDPDELSWQVQQLPDDPDSIDLGGKDQE